MSIAAKVNPSNDETVARAIREIAQPLSGSDRDFDSLLESIGDARCVLIGEATHGTHEFYRLRAELTQRLIAEKGFCSIAAEADWPDAYRVNRYVRGIGPDADAAEALSDFKRFPAWMWRNADVLDFVGWLREYNDLRAPRERVGFYGLDLYSLHGSIAAVLAYLDKADPAAAVRARSRYACFEDFGEDPQAYGMATSFGMSADCERAVVSQLVELQQRKDSMLRRDGLTAEDEYFQAEQNARVVKDAEEYYRAMFRGRISSWNLRDMHMADTLDALIEHLGGRFAPPKVVVWAHNSHVGDARATEMGAHGELNLGQLTRERHPGHTVLIGFSTYTGTVTAASDWGGPAERKSIRPGLPNSYEALFHQVGLSKFLLKLRDLEAAFGKELFDQQKLQRAIGVIYKPESERQSHYFHSELARQFDVMLHLDRTRALEPLERAVGWERGELPETFPTGI